MAGALTALAGSGDSSGGGAVPSPTPVWSPIYDTDVGSTTVQTISGIGGSISVAVVQSGGGALWYTLGSGLTLYSGAFPVSAGSDLGFTIFNHVGGGTITGTLTVKNMSDGGTTLGVISYLVFDSGGH